MQFSEIRDYTSFLINFNDGQSDQNITTARLNQLINYAYQRLVRLGIQEGNAGHILDYEDFTWTASSVTKTLPTTVRSELIYQFRDVTSGAPGTEFVVGQNPDFYTVYYSKPNELSWGSTGPSSTKTIRCYYWKKPATMSADADLPSLLPDLFHELICWETAIDFRLISDQNIPNGWAEKREELRMDLFKYWSRGRPASNSDWFAPRLEDLNYNFY